MIQAIQKRLSSKDEGFTLIELMVVVLIIAILIAIAIPTFLGARTRAQDRAAQTDLRNAVLAAEVHYVDTEDYDATAADLEAIEPELDFDVVANSSSTVIGLVEDDDTIQFVRESEGGTFFCIQKDEATGTFYGSGAALADVDTLAECTGAAW